MPARKITNTPLATTSNAVPRSGWFAISAAGTAISTATVASEASRGGNSRWFSTHAAIIGTVSLASSDGWNLSIFRSSQRCVPRPSPSAATASSRTMLPAYNQGVQLRSACGGTREISSSSTVPSTKRSPWLITMWTSRSLAL